MGSLLTVLVMVSGAGVVRLAAQTPGWTIQGPFGGFVSFLAVDPRRPDAVYVSTPVGIFRGGDGTAWAPVRIPGASTPFLIDPQNPNALYAGSLTSADAGESWNKLDLPGTADLLAIDPWGGLYASAHDGSLSKSSDRGAHWTSLGTQRGILYFDPQDSSTIYAVRESSSLFKTIDGGATWVHLDLPGNAVRAVAVDLRNSTAVYAVTPSGRGILKSDDGGATWRSANSGLTNGASAAAARGDSDFLIVTLLQDALNAGTLYALASDFSSGHQQYVFRSTDRAESWIRIASPPADTFALAIATNSGTLYANTFQDGVFKSRDGAGSWSPLDHSGLPATSVNGLAIDPQNSDNIFAAGQPGGVFRSTDAARSWTVAASGLTPPLPGMSVVSHGLTVDPGNPLHVYVLFYGGLYHSADRGGSWTPIRPECASAGTCPGMASFTLDSQSPGVIYGGSSPGVLKSVDSGATWSVVNPGWPGFFVSALAADPNNAGTLYANTQAEACGDGDNYCPPDEHAALFKSVDGGATWTALALPQGHRIGAPKIDPQDSDTLYVFDLRSTDGGESWAALSLPQGTRSIAAIGPDRSLFALDSASGLFESLDQGASWRTVVPTGETPFSINVLTVGPQNPGKLYAGSTGGVLSLDLPPER